MVFLTIPQPSSRNTGDLAEAGVPVTNYGMLLSYAHSPDAVRRALAPWGITWGLA